MRLNFTYRIFIAFCISSFFLAGEVKGQDFTEIFKAPGQDAQTYLNNYVSPAMLSFANGMSGGWYNTAKPHKTLGFDLTFTVNMANIPSSERSFAFNNSDYNNLRSAGSGGQYPTMVGGPTTEQLSLSGSYTDPATGRSFTYTSTETFTAPEGADVEGLPIAGIPVPMLQLGVGIIKNTDIKLRFGKFNQDDYNVKLFGLGVMHDFKQWIPGIKHIPVDMSIFAGFSKLNATVNILESGSSFDADGEAELTASNTTIQVLVSKKLAILTPYFGIGYNAVSSSLKVTGRFENRNITDDISGAPLVLNDPIDLTFDGGSGLRSTLGLRIKLAVITLHVDYTLQKYNMLTAGFGFSFR